MERHPTLNVPVPTPEKLLLELTPALTVAGSELCFIHTEKTREKESTRCVFPFTFKGKTHLRCTKDESVNGKEWCATEVNADGVVITGQWGDCDFRNIKCFTLGGGGGGLPAAPQQQAARPQPRQPAPAPRQRSVFSKTLVISPSV